MKDLLALWDVVRVAMLCMMSVIIFGVYFNALFPKLEAEKMFECDFNMGKSIMTAPCTIRGEWYED